MYSLFVLALCSFLLSTILTPLVRNAFRRYGVLDYPNEKRKEHAAPVPRVGGIPIVLSFAGAFLALLISPLHAAQTVNLPFVWKLMPAAALVFLVGLVDDLVRLRPWQKLTVQILASGLAYWAGVRILGVSGYQADMWLTLPLTVLWLVGCTNAFNLIDGVDGLAAGVGLFATLTTFVAALLHNNTALAMATVPLAGALLGFLRYNFNPASIFLGDSGSLLIGFLLGCYGAIWSQKSATVLGLTAPLMALAIPLLDTGIAVIRRFLRHQPVFGGDRDHIHHRLMARGFSQRKVVLMLYGVCGLAASFSLLQSMQNKRFGGLILIIFCAVAWLGIQHLGYTELGSTVRWLVAQRTFRRILDAQLHLRKLETALCGAACPDSCWEAIRAASRDYGFVNVRLHLGGKTYSEGNETKPNAKAWSMRIPLSETEYVNFTCNGSASDSVLVLAPFAETVQRALGSRVWSFPARPTEAGVQLPTAIRRVHRAAAGG
jgi:UDP-GlcNAc:undecaprenyl-phosphate GlcNAc-1-phosphate transferase